MKQDTMRALCAACGCETDDDIRHAWVEREHKGVKYHFVEKQPICRQCGQGVRDAGVDRFNAAESAYCYRRACRKAHKPVDLALDKLAARKTSVAHQEYFTGYEDFANRAIEQAAMEYKTALKAWRRDPDSTLAKALRKEAEEFFKSDQFLVLTSLDGNYLIKEITKAVEKENV